VLEAVASSSPAQPVQRAQPAEKEERGVTVQWGACEAAAAAAGGQAPPSNGGGKGFAVTAVPGTFEDELEELMERKREVERALEALMADAALAEHPAAAGAAPDRDRAGGARTSQGGGSGAGGGGGDEEGEEGGGVAEGGARPDGGQALQALVGTLVEQAALLQVRPTADR
jgi:hypothetical protein